MKFCLKKGGGRVFCVCRVLGSIFCGRYQSPGGKSENTLTVADRMQRHCQATPLTEVDERVRTCVSSASEHLPAIVNVYAVRSERFVSSSLQSFVTAKGTQLDLNALHSARKRRTRGSCLRLEWGTARNSNLDWGRFPHRRKFTA